jgi:enamine deaminase RidA (YjgF/YER057c/UK114 family)
MILLHPAEAPLKFHRTSAVLKSDWLRSAMRPFLILLLCGALTTSLLAQKPRKKKPEVEPRPQTLEVIPEPPEAIVAEPGRLSFQVSPLSDKGLLSQQVHDALKALVRLNHGAPILKLRAFVAGSGDLRRVKDIVAEDLTEKKLALPAVSTIQVGALPMPGAQVAIEAVSSEKKVVNPSGVAFVPAVESANAAAAMAQLGSVISSAGIKAVDVLRITCFMSSLDDVGAARSAAATAFPSAAANFVQKQRLGLERQVLCEAAARLTTVSGSPPLAGSGLALINSPKIVLTATQLVFRDQDSDFRLAYQRLAKTMAPLGATFKDVFWTGNYALTLPNAAKIERLQWEFLDRAHPPATTALQIEGLPSTDATAAIEFMAVSH